MGVFRTILNFRPGASRLAMVAAVFTFAGMGVASTQAQQPPYSLFQYSTLTGSGNTISATQVPVITAAGTTTYTNLTIQFDVDSGGNLTISAGYPQFVPAPAPIVSSFKAGKYVGPGTVYSGSLKITVGGPSTTDGGASEWSLAATPDAGGCTYPASALWYVPFATNPLSDRLKTAGITSTAWSYGISSGSQCIINGDSWGANSLIGVSQVGNTLTIVSFTKSGKDSALPVDQITYTLTP